MELPAALKISLEKEMAHFTFSKRQAVAEELSARYRQPHMHKTFMTSADHHLAYLATRMPATFAAIKAVLIELADRLPQLTLETLLDIGSGPGTALWAVKEVFPHLSQATLVEQDKQLLMLAERLLQANSTLALQFTHASMVDTLFNPHDLVIFSYSLNELSSQELLGTLENGWAATNKIIAIIEPGTPLGFKGIRKIREHLISLGAYLVAPCPNHLTCPMQGTDWCHFSARLQRSAEHMHAKNASVGYEDEKYAYVIASKTPVELPLGRILTPPQKRTGHVNFSLCMDGQVMNKTVSRRDKSLYKQARKWDWGSAYEDKPVECLGEEDDAH